jgi:hypothetical protein
MIAGLSSTPKVSETSFHSRILRSRIRRLTGMPSFPSLSGPLRSQNLIDALEARK